MKISGFTIIKNAVINDYPITEAITSILPVVDEMIVLVGDSTDETRALIETIKSDKIRIHESIWDPAARQSGRVLALETDKAFQLIDPASDWAFYIQADEVVHEKFYPEIIESCKKYKDDRNVDGLLFKYLHFYGSYNYVGDSRKWYKREARIIRNDKSISSYRDAQGFRKGNSKIRVKLIEAYIYHYGWVKSPAQMKRKLNEVYKYWNPNWNYNHEEVKSEELFNFDDFDSLDKFRDTHPEVMQSRIARQNWNVEIDITKKRFSLKDKFLYWFEKQTGIQLFGFKNYKII